MSSKKQDTQDTKDTALRRLIDRYFAVSRDIRVRMFNVLAIGGVIVSLCSAIAALTFGEPIRNAVIFFVYMLIAGALLWYSNKSGRYRLCYIITIVAVFIIGFPLFFFSAGMYYGAMPYFFIFAVVFTIFMLDGKAALIIAGLEGVIYTISCLYAYFYLEIDPHYIDGFVLMREALFGFLLVSAVLGVTMFIQIRLYNAQQKKLNEQNTLLEQANKTKTEFLTNASHEMRTPLTVVSVNIQTVLEILEDMPEKDTESSKLLINSQKEIMRLSRMVGSMLKLASMYENTDKQKLDLTSLLLNTTEMLRLNVEKSGNTLKADIEPDLYVFGNADLLSQVLTNLLQNARAHTESGTVTVTAKKQGNEITVSVFDTGTGISPELLPRVFERGVSTGGTGFGLYLCKTVVESHGGRIWIESNAESGTAVFYALPYYEGQFGGEPE